MKFPTDRGIVTIKPKKEALLIVAAEEDEEKKQEKILELSIHPSYPDQKVKISNDLSPMAIRKLKYPLRESKDVFAWCPANMVGVPRDTAEHSLNIAPGIKPIIQKKKSLAPDRSQAACMEVDKLVEAGILREVQYQSWVANPVLKMPFDLKNAGATYQRVIDKTFADQIGRNMEPYVDDLVIKSKNEEGMIKDIKETFDNLRSISMKLNPGKCSFGFEEGKFLGHIVGKQSIKANPSKVRAVMEMRSPRTKKDVQSLNGKIDALKRFLSKSAEKSLPFFQTLKGCLDKKDFRWTEEAEAAFQKLKENLASLPTMVAPEAGELIFVYLSAGSDVVRAVLLIERNHVQMSVYFISRALKEAEINYPTMEKLSLSLVHTARILRWYFQAHPIRVVTDQPIRTILERPETSGRLAKWAIELGEHKIEYVPRTAIKAQVLADFLAEVPEEQKEEAEIAKNDEQQEYPPNTWKLFADGASSIEGSGAGLVLLDREGKEFTYALRLDFPSTNNEAEYEALLAGLRIAKEMKVSKIQVFVDSLLIASQVNNKYLEKEESMKKYKAKAQELMQGFETCNVKQVPRSKNKQADALNKLASLTFAHLTKKVLVEVLKAPSICEEEINDVITEEEKNWMTPVIDFLKEGKLPDDEAEAVRLQIKAKQYVIEDGYLYKKSYLSPLLRCVGPDQSNYLIREVHEGICGTHSGPRSVVTKLMNLGYYWPTMHKDASKELHKCEGCQLHAPIKASPKHDRVTVTSAWPFYKWGMDIVGPFREARGKVKFLLVAVDYFTKWPEVKPLASITGKQDNGENKPRPHPIQSSLRLRSSDSCRNRGSHTSSQQSRSASRQHRDNAEPRPPRRGQRSCQNQGGQIQAKNGVLQQQKSKKMKVSKLETWYSETTVQADKRIPENWALNGKAPTRLQKHTEEVHTNLMTWKEKGFQGTGMPNTYDASSYKQ
ncbi:hypothetical protein L1987_54443 [Smallanthus sonchifolius]|uniref:Uncharacterized protein n=1 Tax=Smallanthus sonchifolius TaxID=185202 RepID=A0ACB9E7F2_9ASTR|nr:hypothetical protein L1987_54443 [Smallanthus sonchifolius]